MRRLLMGAVALAVSGCASTLEPALQSSVGRPLSDLTARIGAPDDSVQLPGGRAYTWRRSYDLNGNTFTCALRVQTDAADHVSSYTVDSGLCDDLIRVR